ncbi:hypothetical protein L3X38_002771 [Prunus dulcis]|uniref:Transposable element protein n=1 Tax=Prunus dulcis TaxID=3755 RepID=A0AAD4WUM0_PRUDU|nr:hypothetical protein L3X38_002771 [Prunus dulcis]
MVGTRLYVPHDEVLNREILEEAHSSAFAMHPGSTKMYHTLRKHYWRPFMKKEIAEYVRKCLICQQNKHDGVWVIVDRLTKSAHFLPLLEPSYSSALLFILKRQSERTIQTLEDMLRACALQFREDWDEKLPLMEFAYNNSYQASIRMSPFDALYGKRRRTPFYWDEVGENRLEVADDVERTKEQVKIIRERLKTAQDRQKSYANNRRKDLQFEVGDWVFLKLSPWKGVVRFGRRGKLSPRYIGPYEIVERVGPVAYRIALPPDLSRLHDVFHVLEDHVLYWTFGSTFQIPLMC